jgi:hypothetical protein
MQEIELNFNAHILVVKGHGEFGTNKNTFIRIISAWLQVTDAIGNNLVQRNGWGTRNARWTDPYAEAGSPLVFMFPTIQESSTDRISGNTSVAEIYLRS